jgi:hypothetical protein
MRVAVVIFEMARKSFFVNVGEEYITSHKNAAPLFWKMRLFLGCWRVENEAYRWLYISPRKARIMDCDSGVSQLFAGNHWSKIVNFVVTNESLRRWTLYFRGKTQNAREKFADHILEKLMFARMLKNRKEGPRTILYLPVLRTDHDADAWTFAVTCE